MSRIVTERSHNIALHTHTYICDNCALIMCPDNDVVCSKPRLSWKRLEVVAVVAHFGGCCCLCLCCRLVVPNVHPVARHRVCCAHTGCHTAIIDAKLPEGLPAKLQASRQRKHCSGNSRTAAKISAQFRSRKQPFCVPYPQPSLRYPVNNNHNAGHNEKRRKYACLLSRLGSHDSLRTQAGKG